MCAYPRQESFLFRLLLRGHSVSLTQLRQNRALSIYLRSVGEEVLQTSEVENGQGKS